MTNKDPSAPDATPSGGPANTRAEAPVSAYEEMYEDDTAYDLPYTQSHYYPMFAATLDEMKRLGGNNVLEVGCGSGSFAQMVFDRTSAAYHGFDFSKTGVEKAIARNGKSDVFSVSNALEADSYARDFDTIVCTEVLEHIERDLDVVAQWPAGVNCVCSVPNFDFATHVRHFLHEDEVRARYGELIDIEKIVRAPRSLIRGRGVAEYLRQLRWNRNNPKRFMALLGYKTFDNLAGWFVFSGKRRG